VGCFLLPFPSALQIIEAKLSIKNMKQSTIVAVNYLCIIAAMKEVWNSRESLYPFSFGFVDQDLDNMYRSEQQVSTLFSAFAILAIVISCLGLYGLSAYIAEQRSREIGIRKALGASIGDIIYY
jgi:ABC-type antimicrobial peptide transport system permease subunit